MKKLVERKGQKFQFQVLILEAKGFLSEDGIMFETAEEAIRVNPKSNNYMVRNKEFEGDT